MDFSHVYSVCGVIRDLKTILENLKEERFIILTHNNEFMRILSSNNLIGAERLFSRGEFKKYSTTLTVPYVSHLQDMFYPTSINSQRRSSNVTSTFAS